MHSPSMILRDNSLFLLKNRSVDSLNGIERLLTGQLAQLQLEPQLQVPEELQGQVPVEQPQSPMMSVVWLMLFV